MTSFIKYQLLNYVRSLRFIPASTLFLCWIFISYAYNNNPILSSYAVSSISLYLIMTWITMTLFTLEQESEKHMLFTHLGNKQAYLVGKWAACLCFAIPLFLFAEFYPILTGNFEEAMSGTYYVISFYSHFILGLFGILVGTIFSATRFAMKRYAWLSAMLVLMISLASEKIEDSFQLLKWPLLLFPPVLRITSYLEGGAKTFLSSEFWLDTSFVIVYGVLGFTAATLLFLRTER